MDVMCSFRIRIATRESQFVKLAKSIVFFFKQESKGTNKDETF